MYLYMMKFNVVLAVVLQVVYRVVAENVRESISVDPNVLHHDRHFGPERMLELMPIRVTMGSRTFSSDKGGGLVETGREVSHGEDLLGRFQLISTMWTAENVTWRFQTTIALYEDKETIIYGQIWPDGAKGTLVDKTGNKISSAFPGFQSLNDELGILSFNGRFMETSQAFPFSNGDKDAIGGERGGPVVIYNKAMDQVIAISPLTPSMAMGVEYEHNIVQFGLLGSIGHVPKEYTIQTIVVLGHGGITETTRVMGQKVIQYFGTKQKRLDAIKGDISLNYLGYATDNGAYYYYLTENGKNYETTLLHEYEYAKKEDIPIRYIQLDSWWYSQGVGGGVSEWTARSDVFPSGLKAFSNKTEWPLFLHNRYWARDNVYMKDYHFLVDGLFSIPTEQRFWDDLIQNATEWGMAVYEQDWLYNEFEQNFTLGDPQLGTTWLRQMGQAAWNNNVTIQYCMALPRMVVASAEFPAVTQVRAGDDYHPGNTEDCHFCFCLYYIHTTSLLLWSLDLAPSKDVFWTTEKQPGNRYHGSEPHADLLTVVSILSKGPVHFGDKIGYTDRGLVMQTCTTNGRLLQPSRPATALDLCFLGAAFRMEENFTKALSTKGPGVCGVMSTFTKIGKRKWPTIFATLTKGEIKIGLKDIPMDYNHPKLIWYDSLRHGFHHKNDTIIGLIEEEGVITIPQSDASNFTLYHLAPVFPNGVAFLGEVGKIVPVSEFRTVAVKPIDDSISNGLSAILRGNLGESVVVLFVETFTRNTFKIKTVKCTFTPETSTTMVAFSHNETCVSHHSANVKPL